VRVLKFPIHIFGKQVTVVLHVKLVVRLVTLCRMKPLVWKQNYA